MRKILVTLAFLFILSGCAVSPVSTTQEKNKITVVLSGTSDDSYRLYNDYDGYVARADGRDGSLVFTVPEYADTSRCFTVKDKNGKNIYENNTYFSTPLISELRQSQKERRAYEDKITQLQGNAQQFDTSYNDHWVQFRKSPAFNAAGNTCRLPAQKTIPPKPYAKCTSEQQCKEDGAAICFTRFIGEAGCGVASKKLGISEFLSNPGCAAAAADLAGQKYGMEDAFVDALNGAIKDVANTSKSSESPLENIIGHIIDAGVYAYDINSAVQCTSKFIETNYGPVRKWLAEQKSIEAEPQLAMNQCKSLVNSINADVKNINSVNEQIKMASGGLLMAKEKESKLYNEKRSVSNCSSKSPRF